MGVAPRVADQFKRYEIIVRKCWAQFQAQIFE
jgi:hypothetical protein